jgi:hypothetical protein
MERIQPDKALMLDSPLVFEIGQNGAKELRATDDKDTNELFKEFKRYLRHLSCFIGLGILLVVWTRSVSRVPLASSNAKTEAGEIENEESIKK